MISEEFLSSGYNFETTATQPGNESSNSNDVTQLQDNVLGSDNHTDYKGEESLSKNKVPFDGGHCYAIPEAVDLDTSKLRHSKRIQELNKG